VAINAAADSVAAFSAYVARDRHTIQRSPRSQALLVLERTKPGGRCHGVTDQPVHGLEMPPVTVGPAPRPVTLHEEPLRNAIHASMPNRPIEARATSVAVTPALTIARHWRCHEATGYKIRIAAYM
jgi:hypothetical protein